MNVFDVLPAAFFNCLSSGSSGRIYSDCLLTIYHEYDREITYRIPRNRVRDALAIYLMEHQVDDLEDGGERETNYNQLANAVIRKFCAKETGWLEEDTDDATYEKNIVMTEQGVLLAEFLQRMMKPEREEFSSYIFNIYNILRNPEQWKDDPYVNGLRAVYRNARQLSKALKRLATYIKKIIERMVREETLESLTENILEYCDGDFIREYARLTKQQNIHIYRSFIRTKLEELERDPDQQEYLVIGCSCEEDLEEAEARDRVQEMFRMIRQFFAEDYDQIMRDIKHKINVYLQIAVGRARFLRNRDSDARGRVEQTIRILAQEMEELDWKDELPEAMAPMFLLENHEFLDLDSVRYPKKTQTIRKASYAELEEMTQEDIDRARAAQEYEARNPYAKEKVKEYLNRILGDRAVVSSDELPLESKQDLLNTLSAAAYGEENGFEIQADDGYTETQHMLLRRFTVKREKRG